MLGAAVSHFQAHFVAKVTVRQFAAQRGAQILDFFLVDEQVAVARQAELITPQHLHAAEQFADMFVQHRRQEHEVIFDAGHALRQADHPRQHPRRLHDGGARVAAEGVLALEFDRKIQALVEHPRKRVRGIKADRRQHRHHFALEITAYPFVLLRRELAPPQETNTLPLHARQDLFVQQLVLPRNEFVCFPRDMPIHLFGTHLIGTNRR